MNVVLPRPGLGLDAETIATAVARYKALGDRTRLAIVAMLQESPEPLCVCHITERFDLEQPTISHHLGVLRQAGLITSERHANWVYYQLDPRAEAWVRQTLAVMPH
jgi:ArsR family transcriptional regulator